MNAPHFTVKDCANLSLEELDKKIYSLQNTYSAKKEPSIFIAVLHAYLSKILTNTGSDSKEFSVEQALERFLKHLKTLNSRSLLLYEADRNTSHYYYDSSAYRIQEGSLTGALLVLYSRRLADRPEKVAPQIYCEVAIQLNSMADDVKSKDLGWNIYYMKQADQKLSRPIDPMFETLLSLYGLSIVKPAVKKRYYTGNTEVLSSTFHAQAQTYLDAVYQRAKFENKISTLNSWLQTLLIDPEYKDSKLALQASEEIFILKEKKQIQQVVKNYNKKEIKKNAKERATLANLQELLVKNQENSNPTSGLESGAIVSLNESVKPKKFKL